mmetsp:Transcript_1432/g.3714  ORF Transcript_1432/g.3714 Transcript_1432/m.3714 type:complete len:587 (-) Transcript_1432:278-2038(-)
MTGTTGVATGGGAPGRTQGSPGRTKGRGPLRPPAGASSNASNSLEDKFSLEVIKERLSTFQQEEIDRGRQQLLLLRKAYDKLKVEVEDRVKRLEEADHHADQAHAEMRTLGKGENEEYANLIADLERRIEETAEQMETARFRSSVLDHMGNRLKGDILKEKKKGAAINRELMIISTELKATHTQYQQAKQELKNQQDDLHGLRSQIGELQEAHKKKMDGIVRLLDERNELVQEQVDLIKRRDEVVEQATGDVRKDEKVKLNKVEFVRNMYGVLLEKQHVADEEQLGTLEEQFHMLKNVTGLTSVEAIIEKFKGREGMSAMLLEVADDARKRIETLREYNEETTRAVEDIKASTEAGSGNREVYQELDLIDSALTTARRQCSDSTERAARMHVILNEVQRFVKRLLERVNNTNVPVPPMEKVPEALSQLDSKVSQMTKAVHSAVTQEDAEAGNALDGNPQGLQLEQLFQTQVGQTLFESIHGEAPVATENNVRVRAKKTSKTEVQQMRNSLLLGEDYDDLKQENVDDNAFHLPTMKELMNNYRHKEENIQDFIVDRDTIKKLSDLIVARERLARMPRRVVLSDSDDD